MKQGINSNAPLSGGAGGSRWTSRREGKGGEVATLTAGTAKQGIQHRRKVTLVQGRNSINQHGLSPVSRPKGRDRHEFQG